MNKKLIRLFLILGILIISTGVLIYFTIYFYNNISRREFSNEKIYTVSYPEGDVGLSVYLILGPGNYPGAYSCYANIQFSSFTDGDLEINGISYVRLNIYKDGSPVSYDEINLIYLPTSWVSYNSIGEVFKDNNVTVIGIARVSYNIDESSYNELFRYQISVVPPSDITGGIFTQTIPFIWIEFIVVLALIVSVASIMKVVSSIRTEFFYSKEEKEKDEKFWDYIKQKRNQQNQ